MSSPEQATTLAAAVLFPVLGAAVVGLRLGVRRCSGAPLRADDWLCLPTLAALVACGALIAAGMAASVLGFDDSSDTPQDTPAQQQQDQEQTTQQLQKLSLAFEVLQSFGVAGAAASALFLYRRVFPSHRCLRVACIVAGVLVAQWLLVSAISVVVIGTRRLLHADTGDANRPGEAALLIALAIEGVLVDAAVVLLPVPALLRPPQQSHPDTCDALVAAGLFLAGAGAVAVGIARLVVPAAAAPEAAALGFAMGDAGTADPQAVVQFLLWGLAQLACMLVAACLPAFGPLLRRRERSPSVADTTVPETAAADRTASRVENRVSMRFLAPPWRRGKSSAPNGAILVQKQVVQVVETV